MRKRSGGPDVRTGAGGSLLLHQLYAPVLGAPFLGLIGRHGRQGTDTLGIQTRHRHAVLAGQGCHYGACAAPGAFHIVHQSAHVIGVTYHMQSEARVGLEQFDDLA